ncbi:MAG: carbamoyltransferase HypF [Deltaproteobacteria bacterium]|nr:carbamoyltransferase HypF [Candidatus Anaeroferrophillacea bacterium]
MMADAAVKLTVRGTVQGVGFRPYVYRLAVDLGLAGSVANTPRGVEIRVRGASGRVEDFVAALGRAAPPRAVIRDIERQPDREPPAAAGGFVILAGTGTNDVRPCIPPDIALCGACRRELHDPADRRRGYPFINCTDCGPRFSIVRSLPYDRPRTSMAAFDLCPACAAEYDNPSDRRFHAEPVACQECGPRLMWIDADGSATTDDPLGWAGALLAAGGIVAIHGLGGFHLAVAAGNPAAVVELRRRKGRPHKPLALMARDLETVTGVCRLTPVDEAVLTSPEAPIVLMARHGVAEGAAAGATVFAGEVPVTGMAADRDAAWGGEVPSGRRGGGVTGKAAAGMARGVFAGTAGENGAVAMNAVPDDLRVPAPEVAPGLDEIGVMLPYTPLHELLFAVSGVPPLLVMTSGNLSDEPICRTVNEARERLVGIADGFLVHDREIVAAVDDSLGKVIGGHFRVFRRARGYVPRPVILARELTPVLAVGGMLKSTFCLARGCEAVLSQHLGDLEDLRGEEFFDRCLARLRDLLCFTPRIVARDLHPDYPSSHLAARLAAEFGAELISVQHHHAHAAAVLAEHRLETPVIAVILDGTGWGGDGTVWGGEVLRVEADACERIGHLDHFPLPGGDAAAREPWRSAAALIFRQWGIGVDGDLPFEAAGPPAAGLREVDARRRRLLVRMMERGVNTPLTSSCGRLFDGVAALLGRRQMATYEGQAAMELEALARRAPDGTGGGGAGFGFAAGRRGAGAVGRAGIAAGDGDYAVRLETRTGCRGAEMDGVGSYAVNIAIRDGCRVVHYDGLLAGLHADLAAGVPAAVPARRFHRWLVDSLLELVCEAARETGICNVVFGGGCLQNALLLEGFDRAFRQAGLHPYLPEEVPANDGGLALGQALVAGARVR